MVDALDAEIDRYMDRVSLPPKFVIPGGTQLSAQLDLARAILRRAERRAVALRDEQGLASEAVLRYLNRASDLVYAMARFTDSDDPELFEGRGRERRSEGRRAPHRGLRPPTSRSTATSSTVDEPAEDGGTDTGPSPTRLLTASLAVVHRDHDRDVRRPQGMGRRRARGQRRVRCAPSAARRRASTSRSGSRGARATSRSSASWSIAGKCPVHRTLVGEVEVDDRVERV